MSLKIAVCVAGFHPGNTGEYMITAFQQANHSVDLLNSEQTYQAAHSLAYDHLFCVDSGETFDFSRLPETSLEGRLSMWFIDYRHNKDRPERVPTDRQNVNELAKRSARIFQAQYEDAYEVQSSGNTRCEWLPVAADPQVWSNDPTPVTKQFDLGFIGNVWDHTRKNILEHLIRSGITLGFPGHGRAWKEEAAALLRSCRIGFNVPTFYGSPVAYDLNMRFFETLSCGIPLITNWVPSIERLFPELPPFIRVYHTPSEILPVIRSALQDSEFLGSGSMGRAWIEKNATYHHRATKILSYL